MPTLRPTRLERLGSTTRPVVNTNGMPRTITKKDTTKSGQDVTTLVEATELRMMMNGSMIGVTMLILLRQSQSVTIQIRSATVMLPSM